MIVGPVREGFRFSETSRSLKPTVFMSHILFYLGHGAHMHTEKTIYILLHVINISILASDYCI